MTIADGQLIQAADHLRHSNASGYADLAASTILTIARSSFKGLMCAHVIWRRSSR